MSTPSTILLLFSFLLNQENLKSRAGLFVFLSHVKKIFFEKNTVYFSFKLQAYFDNCIKSCTLIVFFSHEHVSLTNVKV